MFSRILYKYQFCYDSSMVTIKVSVARTLWQKSKGLIGEKKITPMLIHTRFGIHTFGVRFPIDVIVLDREQKVVKLKENLAPNSMFFWNPTYNTILELPEGYIARTRIKYNSSIQIEIV